MSILANREGFPSMYSQSDGRKTHAIEELRTKHPPHCLHVCLELSNESFETVFKLEGNIFM